MNHLDEAIEILQRVKGRPLHLKERKDLSIQLASCLLSASQAKLTFSEKRLQQKLAKMMEDPKGKAFTTAITDQCFRSQSNLRIADQMIYLIKLFGVPSYLSWLEKMGLYFFRILGPKISALLMPLAIKVLRKETESVILPAEVDALNKHLKLRKSEGIRLNLNYLGEAILSEKEARTKFELYKEALEHPDIDYLSIKISTIFSQIHLISFEDSAEKIAQKLRELYRLSMKKEPHKFINLDMEEYRDLELTVRSFQKVLDEPEFFSFSAGVVLQAYLPDSFEIQKELTEWAKKRVQSGGAPIKIRIVKGANLAMEQCEASEKGWEQAPYTQKVDVDANYKRMLIYGLKLENARAVRIGIASHNLFDLSFAMLLRAENQVEGYSDFEMLEGMAPSIRRIVQMLTGDILLYCPVAKKEDFQYAIAYLIRRLDENTGYENFLRHLFHLKPGTEDFDAQVALFSQSCDIIETVQKEKRRGQNRQLHPPLKETIDFENEPDTDFSLEANRIWAEKVTQHWEKHTEPPIPLVIAGEKILNEELAEGSNPNASLKSQGAVKPLYTYSQATQEQIEAALKCAKEHEKPWSETTVEHRSSLLKRTAQIIRQKRGELIGTMLLDGGKLFSEADPEVSEAIDFLEYYRRQMEKMSQMKDISSKAKGTILVASPWNFPCAIPIGGIASSLMSGNCTLFKPSSRTILVGWHLIQCFWEAGIPKEVLQFIPYSTSEFGNALIQNPKLTGIILTGSTKTALDCLKIRPNLKLAAETGGKNAIIVTALADRDLAIKDLLHSAFSNSGQKCSATSLAILEQEVYDDPHFLKALKEAAKSLKVGSSFDLSSKMGPLIQAPKGPLKRALTSLEEGEEWLLKPGQDENNPCLWTPGIKIGVRRGGFTHMTELFGPVLAVMRANNLEDAIEIANEVPYGLTSGLHSLDQREQKKWLKKIEAGNLYINRGTTGAIVRRQPFGGYKASSIGSQAKAGGPNYLTQFMKITQINIPQEKHPINEAVNQLTLFLDHFELTAEQLGIWTASSANYAYWWKRMKQDQDLSKLVGQDNFFRYVPKKQIFCRIRENSNPFDFLRVCAAALTCSADLTVSYSLETLLCWPWLKNFHSLKTIEETEEKFLQRIVLSPPRLIRLIDPADTDLLSAAAKSGVLVIDQPVLASGRLELPHYLQEVSISTNYHRYGNLGLREAELRRPIL